MMTKKNVIEPGRTPNLLKQGAFERKLDSIVEKFEAKHPVRPLKVKPTK